MVTRIYGTEVVQGFDETEIGVTSLVGINDQVAADKYTNTADMALSSNLSGYLTRAALVASETGTGAILKSSGTLLFFDADPNVSAGDSALAAAGAEHKTAVLVKRVLTSDWTSCSKGGTATIVLNCTAFHHMSTV